MVVFHWAATVWSGGGQQNNMQTVLQAVPTKPGCDFQKVATCDTVAWLSGPLVPLRNPMRLQWKIAFLYILICFNFSSL